MLINTLFYHENINAALSLLTPLEEVGVKIQLSLWSLCVCVCICICTLLRHRAIVRLEFSLETHGTRLANGLFVSCVPSIMFYNRTSTTHLIPNPLG